MPFDKRLTTDWLTTYLEFTEDHEAVEAIHKWVGLTLIAGALQRKVYLELEHGTVFPNLYVIIVAESAKARKSAAMDLGRNLFQDALPEVKTMSDSMTSQGLIKAMNRKVMVEENGKQVEAARSDVFIFADEVANLFGYDKQRAAQLTIFLTRAYTCPRVYDHTTARDNTVRCHNVYPTLLGGTDPRNLKVIPDEAAGGLTGRLIWLIESKRRKNNPGWIEQRRLVERKARREMLMHDLIAISNLEGTVQVSAEAQKLYTEWYAKLSSRDEPDPDTDAFYNRCHTTALQVAILLCISRTDTLKLNEDDMMRAITMIEEQLPTVKRVMLWSGASPYQQHRNKLLMILYKTPKHLITRKIGLRDMGLRADEFDEVLKTLEEDGSIDIPRNGKGEYMKLNGEVLIRLTTEGLERVATFAQSNGNLA